MKNTFIRLSLIANLVLATIGCQSHSVQTTSGRQYLNKYEGLDLPNGEAGSIDEEVRAIANVEPTLRFPARIGLAKLYNGRISNLTAEEENLRKALIANFEQSQEEGWTEANLSANVPDAAREVDLPLREAYRLTYELLLGVDVAPKLAPLLAAMEPSRVLRLMRGV